MRHSFIPPPPSALLLTLAFILGALAAGPCGHAAPADPPQPRSLARTYPIEKLAEILIPPDRWKPFPTARDREQWQALPKPVLAHLIALGEEAMGKPIQNLPATLYLGYARQGNRSNYEGPYFDRRARLQNLVLAECVEGKGRFLDAALDTLWAIGEESSWCLPAHVGVQKARVGLPDVTEPIVDLFAAESGVGVAWTLYLLGPELDRVSPQARRRAQLELERRILAPVLDRNDFGWMALEVTRADRRPNNWTPWIAASVLTTTLLSEPEPARRVALVHKMLRSVDGFLKFHPADGSCDEGPSYWGRAGGSLLDCLDILHSASGGQLDVFNDPVVQEIGRFIYRAHIANDYFVPIGDCAARFTPERDLVFRYGRRIKDENLIALAAHGASVPSILGDRFLGRQVHAVFNAGDILAAQATSPPLTRDVWLSSEDLQLMAARSQAGTGAGLYLAAWGGHNAQSHNHNDVGNVLVFADGQPVFVDVGAPTYTAQTFSARRYEIWAFQSAFHNTPTINGVQQGAGRQFAARNVVRRHDDALAELRMDIAPAYPEAAQVKSWVRTVRLERGREVRISEQFELARMVGDTTLNFITPLEVEVTQPGVLILRGTAEGRPAAAPLRLEHDATKLIPAVERIELTDGRLRRSWGSHLNRLVLRAREASLVDTWTLRIAQEQ